MFVEPIFKENSLSINIYILKKNTHKWYIHLYKNVQVLYTMRIHMIQKNTIPNPKNQEPKMSSEVDGKSKKSCNYVCLIKRLTTE